MKIKWFDNRENIIQHLRRVKENVLNDQIKFQDFLMISTVNTPSTKAVSISPYITHNKVSLENK